MKSLIRSAGLVLAVAPGLAFAHAGLEIAEGAQNTSYKAIVKIGHGCSGSATHTIRIEVPEGMIAAKPMPKPGWVLKVETGPYARSYDYFGKPMTEGVKTIVWSGGNLGDAEYDEFVFVSRITDAVPPGKLYIPVTQTCATGEHAWTQIPKPGEDAHAFGSPAPSLMVKAAPHRVAQAGGGHVGHGAAPAATQPGTLSVSHGWSRATPPGAKVGGGYLTIENAGREADRLIGGSTDASNQFEMHEMATQEGVMRMRALPKGLEIPAGGKVEFKPGGFHIMFIDLKRPLKDGETITGELVFEKAGKVPVTFKVRPLGAPDDGHKH